MAGKRKRRSPYADLTEAEIAEVPTNYVELDTAFQTAMQAAGHALTEPSTRPGTRLPNAHYQRGDI